MTTTLIYNDCITYGVLQEKINDTVKYFQFSLAFNFMINNLQMHAKNKKKPSQKVVYNVRKHYTILIIVAALKKNPNI